MWQVEGRSVFPAKENHPDTMRSMHYTQSLQSRVRLAHLAKVTGFDLVRPFGCVGILWTDRASWTVLTPFFISQCSRLYAVMLEGTPAWGHHTPRVGFWPSPSRACLGSGPGLMPSLAGGSYSPCAWCPGTHVGDPDGSGLPALATTCCCCGH